MLTEEAIVDAVKKMLTGRVNDLLEEMPYPIPAIEFSGYRGAETICPLVVLSSCERTEKERLIYLDAYSMMIAFTLPESRESELYSYTYAAAVKKAVLENPTLGGVLDRAVIARCKYTQPKKENCGEGAGAEVLLRLTIEEMRV
jgi:hypothetical protein